MTTATDSRKTSVEEYLEGEKRSEIRHEYVRGGVLAMADASTAHVRLCARLAGLLDTRLGDGPCMVLGSQMKVRIDAADAFYYPDLLVTCDPRDHGEAYFKRRPKLVIEVLSESTADFDHGQKFANYRLLETLEEYVLVDSRTKRVEIFRRRDSSERVLQILGESALLKLESAGLEIPVAEVYRGIELHQD